MNFNFATRQRTACCRMSESPLNTEILFTSSWCFVSMSTCVCTIFRSSSRVSIPSAGLWRLEFVVRFRSNLQLWTVSMSLYVASYSGDTNRIHWRTVLRCAVSICTKFIISLKEMPWRFMSAIISAMTSTEELCRNTSWIANNLKCFTLRQKIFQCKLIDLLK